MFAWVLDTWDSLRVDCGAEHRYTELNGVIKYDDDQGIRLNPSLDLTQTGLDDVDAIQLLGEATRSAFSRQNCPLSRCLDHAVKASIANLFFFEMESLPIWCRMRYECKGSIRCHLTDPEQRKKLRQKLGSQACFTVGTKKVAASLEAHVQFTVHDLHERLRISLALHRDDTYNICGSPQRVDEMLEVQQRSQREFFPLGGVQIVQLKRKRTDSDGDNRDA